MRNRLTILAVLLILALGFSSVAFAQTRAPQAAPAPKHDISGTWEPANGPGDGTQPFGVKAMPNDGKPEHELPYTPLGLEAFKSHKALLGKDAVPPGSGLHNDPRDTCEPIGFPRADFYNLRHTQIMQDPYKVAMLYEYAQTWRIIWTDGRPLPKVVDGGVLAGNEVREKRFYGYSVGKWVDDTTLVVETVGTMGDGKTWMDSVGRPVSDALKVNETFHRVNRDRLELTVLIDDPKMYTKPWVAMDKHPMKLMDPHHDVMEMYCSLSEMRLYEQLIGNPASEGQ